MTAEALRCGGDGAGTIEIPSSVPRGRHADLIVIIVIYVWVANRECSAVRGTPETRWMRGRFRSIEEARRAFDEFARLEPRLDSLWDLCRRAGPPCREGEEIDDVAAVDPFEIDPLAVDEPDNDWCAEDYFLKHVKSKLLFLVGSHRPGEPHPLHSRDAYDSLYDALMNWALIRPCACCASNADDDYRWQHPRDLDRPAWS